MKKMSGLHRMLAAVACLGLIVPQSAWSADVVATGVKPKIVDVKLQDGKVFQGQILNGQGAPQVNADVAVMQDGKVLTQVKTNKEGYFAVSDVNSGVYQVVSDNGFGQFRVWNSSIAPPNAQQGALVVADGSVVRGQLIDMLGNPVVLTLLVATAIAVPIAVSNNNTGS